MKMYSNLQNITNLQELPDDLAATAQCPSEIQDQVYFFKNGLTLLGFKPRSSGGEIQQLNC